MIKKMIALMLFLFAAAPALAENAPPAEILKKKLEEPKRTLADDPFSVSTDDLDSSESLNRVSGEIDLGYSSSEQSYESKARGYQGPFNQERPKA